MMGLVDRKRPMIRSAYLRKVTRARSVDHRCLFQMTKRPQIGHDGTSGQEKLSDACEPWGYVAPVVAAVMTRATGVRHIYLISI